MDGEIVANFIFLGSKITADGDCSNEIKSSFFKILISNEIKPFRWAPKNNMSLKHFSSEPSEQVDSGSKSNTWIVSRGKYRKQRPRKTFYQWSKWKL